MSSGIFLIDKPAGFSSAQVIAKVKRKIDTKEKIGHAGTLDPFATGLLVVLIGKATRLADFFQAGRKIYSGEILLGRQTSTDDITGEILEEKPVQASFTEISAAANLQLGKIEQMPPRVSALKVAGKRAYDMVRKNEDFELKARSVEIFSLELKQIEPNIIFFRISCSKGFYVRAFARDLGAKLGCGACLKTLRREASEPFNVINASLEDKVALSDLIDWDIALKNAGNSEIHVEDREFSALKNGLIPHSLSTKALTNLDSEAQDLLVYRRVSDGLAGGVLARKGQELTIALNM